MREGEKMFWKRKKKIDNGKVLKYMINGPPYTDTCFERIYKTLYSKYVGTEISIRSHMMMIYDVIIEFEKGQADAKQEQKTTQSNGNGSSRSKGCKAGGNSCKSRKGLCESRQRT